MEFRILGPLDVVDGTRVVALPGAKHRALLAMLLLHANEVVSTERLTEALWDEEPPETAQKALHVYVSQLRKVLDSDRLLTKAPGYLIRVEDDELDVAAVRAARAGRDAARGARALARAAARRVHLCGLRPEPRSPDSKSSTSSCLEQRIDARPRRRAARRARRRARGPRRRASAEGAAERAVDARALPLGQAGRGAHDVPRRPARTRRRARDRARAFAPRARAGDPAAGSRARCECAGRRGERQGRSRPEGTSAADRHGDPLLRRHRGVDVAAPDAREPSTELC